MVTIFNKFGQYVKIAVLEAKLSVAQERQKRIVEKLSDKLYQLECDLEHDKLPEEIVNEIKELKKFIDGYKT